MRALTIFFALATGLQALAAPNLHGQNTDRLVLDGWVSAAKVQDKAAYTEIDAVLKALKLTRGPIARSHGHWLIGIHLADKPQILRALRARGFASRVVFSNDPVNSKH